MISVDPGSPPYWAYWHEGQLQECGEWPCFQTKNEALVIEDQLVIPRFTRNWQAIIKLAHMAGACAAEFGYPLEPERVKWLSPRWKGGTPKPGAKAWAAYGVHRRNIQALDPREIAIYTAALAGIAPGDRHNLADAVGIGLFELGRW